MNANDNHEGKTVLITGASSGIGRALAREFAKHQFNIIAVALHDKSLTALKNELLSHHRIEVETVAIDLTQDGSPTALYHEVKNRGYNVDILVNDAGIGQHGYFVEGDWDKYLEIIHLNIVALTKLTHLYAKDMVSRNEGKILQLGSMLGFSPDLL